MKRMNVIKKYAPGVSKATLAGSLMMLGTAAHAALPQSITSVFDSAKADGLEAGWLVVGVSAALFVIFIVKRLFR